MDSEDWIAWQYYSASCRATYGVPEGATVMPAAEDTAMCTKEFSDISPISGADVVFSTLEGRPSADRFEESETLQVRKRKSGFIKEENYQLLLTTDCCFRRNVLIGRKIHPQ
jgi:hypothetical protein